MPEWLIGDGSGKTGLIGVATSDGMLYFAVILTILLLWLKTTRLITWSWWLLLIPILADVLFMFITAIFVAAVKLAYAS